MLKISEILFHLGAFAPDDPYGGAVAARIAWILGVLLIVAGCAAPGSAAPLGFVEGSTLHTMNVGGLDRSYPLYIPSALASPPPPGRRMHGGVGNRPRAGKA